MEIELFSKKYNFPSVQDSRIQHKQEQISCLKKMYAEGSAERKKWFGLKTIPPRYDAEEQLRLMEELVTHYDEVIYVLKQKVDDCQVFFQKMGEGVRATFIEKIAQLNDLEKQRKNLLEKLRAEGRGEMVLALEKQEERLRFLSHNLGQACILIIRKLRHALDALRILSEDEEAQKKVLASLREDVGTFKSILAFNRDLNALQQDINEITRAALNFDDLLSKSLGPLTILIDEISKTDERIAESLAEIQRISQELEGEHSIRGSIQVGDRVLDILVSSQLKQDVLDSIIESITSPAASLEGVDFDLQLMQGASSKGEPLDFEVFSKNITSLVDRGLSQLYSMPQDNFEGKAPKADGKEERSPVIEAPMKTFYCSPVSRAHPTLVVFLLDMSGSMEEPFQGTQSKADFVAASVDRTLEELTVRCRKAEGVRDYFHIACVGFGDDRVWSLLPAEERVLPISVLARNPRTIKYDKDGLPHPSWVLPKAEGNTPLTAAFRQVCQLVGAWCDGHSQSYPPTVILLTDGRSTDGFPTHEAEILKQLHTEDGRTLLFCLHIASGSTPEVLFPMFQPEFDAYGKSLFELSSSMPTHILGQAQRFGYPVKEGSRFFAYGAGSERIAHFFDLGTRPVQML